MVFQDDFDTDSEGSHEIDGEELELSNHIQRRRIQSTSISTVKVNTTTNEVIRSPQPPQPQAISKTRKLKLDSTSTNFQPSMARTSREPISQDSESLFDHHSHWNITGNFTYQN
ncbi:hypothetical protein O181_108232 [Austropuccinia psidii MF-1]|uniref:Uncharacterized protein n=1 Tax=Austropuccinia psidii MF-1 TaxID=1389203 RepID=A0A9Q3JVI4_9BASI|nr:hypothetical protein [Austropuccinia psidii MF-1]